MLRDRIEGKWIKSFKTVFSMCRIKAGDRVAILSETQSRAINVELTELALFDLGANAVHVVIPTREQSLPVPIRSTGSTNALIGQEHVVAMLGSVDAVIDLTVEGLLHSAELQSIIGAGAKVLYISSEHPEVLERLMPTHELKEKVILGRDMLREAKLMRVTSEAGTDLTIDVSGAKVAGGGWGFCENPGEVAHWPGGLCVCFPKAGSINGTVVIDEGDINLTFKRYIERPITLQFENDYAVSIEGKGTDADLMRSYFEFWEDRNAYAAAHVGWGMNPAARWDAMTMYDKAHINGTEQRAFAGNFLLGTGANQFADRYTLCHFDIPMKNCTVTLDGVTIVEAGRLQPPFC